MPAMAAAVAQKHGHEVSTVQGSGMRGASDERIIELCNDRGLILITLDGGIGFLAGRLQTGLLLLRPQTEFGPRQVAQMLDEVLAGERTLDGFITVAAPGNIRSRGLR